MRGHLYLDENVLGHLDDPDVQMALERFRNKGLLPVISHHHLTEICRSPHFELYIPRIERLDPFYLSSEKFEELRRFGAANLSPIDARSEIKFHRENIYSLETGLFGILSPLLKFTGGLTQVDCDELLEEYIASMRETAGYLKIEDEDPLKTLFNEEILQNINIAETEIRKNFSNIAFENESKRWSIVRDKLTASGNIGQVPAECLVEEVINQMTDELQADFTAQFPRGFAKDYSSRADNIMCFSLILYSLGALTGTRRNYKGLSTKQIGKFRSQFLDCLHIGKAGYFNAFVTCDAGAHRLASAVYSYAGVQTLALKMKILPRS